MTVITYQILSVKLSWIWYDQPQSNRYFVNYTNTVDILSEILASAQELIYHIS